MRVPSPALTLASLLASPRVAVAYSEPGLGEPGAVAVGPATSAELSVLVTIAFSNASALDRLLDELSEPASPLYHDYLTAAEFDAEFSPSASVYAELSEYVAAFTGVGALTSFADRASLAFEASPAVVGEIFSTSIEQYRSANETYYAPSSAPMLPAALAASIEGVEGLSSFDPPAVVGGSASEAGAAVPANGSGLLPADYPLPPTVDGVQYEFGTDFQVAYNERSLFDQYGFPTDETVATILWGGTYEGGGGSFCSSLADGEALGPYVPSDLSLYFNETLPAGEPHSTVVPVPIGGAPLPGPLASCDGTDATFENTLDLEMVGSLAPGAHLYNVYAVNSDADLDEAFSYILNPNGTPGLDNVSVISNSWAADEHNDSGWYQDLEEAQARGITVLACSGDSGDDPHTAWPVGPGVSFFPSAMAYDAFGDVSVGGTTVLLNAGDANATGLRLVNQTAWYDAQTHWGSTGGISSVFAEPDWQRTSLANAVLDGRGRGGPDLSAVANNTLITYSVNGYQYRASNATSDRPFEYAYGTSIACPVEAGIVAEIDHVLKRFGEGSLGFLDPELYSLASQQYGPAPSTAAISYDLTPEYSSVLPTLPLTDTRYGANDKYAAAVGYDLVTGWGSLDAYNFSMYVVTLNSSGLPGHLSGVSDRLTLTALNVTTPGKYYTASVQQNLYVANPFGAPVYWVQNVIYLVHTADGWLANYTGWIIYPFFGLWGKGDVYASNWPVAGQLVNPPLVWNISTWMSENASGPIIDYQVNDNVLQLPLPGGSFIIGSLWYNFSWEGQNYTNGPFPTDPYSSGPGGLAPQLGLVGGPSSGVGHYHAPTQGTVNVTLRPSGSADYVAANTEAFGSTIDETGETASDLGWTPTGGSTWTFGSVNGSSEQGILGYLGQPPATHAVTFEETGLAAGTLWSATLNGVEQRSTTPEIAFSAVNGAYAYSVAAVAGYRGGGSGELFVSGASRNVSVAFSASTYLVEFVESGLPGGSNWTVTLGGSPRSSTSASITFEEPNRTYAYVVGSVGPFAPQGTGEGNVVVNGSGSTIDVLFEFTAVLTLEETGLPVGLIWSVNVSESGVGYWTNDSFAGSPITFRLANGTYLYRVIVPDGYSPSPGTGTVTIQGVPVSAPTVTVSSSVGASSSWTPWLEIVGIAVVVGAAAGALLAWRSRRRRSA